MKYKLLFILIIVLNACVSDKELAKATYFGGKIINPKSSHVYFSQNGKLLDSIALNENNSFSFKFDSIKDGVYKFSHGNEFQYIFLEPTDSLLLRLNTWDFDESLAFSGKGAERNNLLINLFLISEKENRLFYKYYPLNDSAFSKKVDSLLQNKKLLLNKFNSKFNESDAFKKYAKAVIELPLYTQKEAYPRKHKMVNKLDKYPNIHTTFYDYRKNIDKSNKDLEAYPPYYNYLREHIYNLSYKKHCDSDKKAPIAINFIEKVGKSVSNSQIKNNLLDEAMWNVCLDNNLTNEQVNKAETIFFKSCNNSNLSSEIKQILDAKAALPNNSKLPELIIYNKSFNKVRLNDVVKNQKSVVYFWPKKNFQVEYLAKRIKYLEKHYPDVLFIGVNSKFPIKSWNGFLANKKFDAKNQFLLDKELKNDWLHLDFSRAIIIDKHGIVKNSFTHLNTSNFQKQLKNID